MTAERFVRSCTPNTTFVKNMEMQNHEEDQISQINIFVLVYIYIYKLLYNNIKEQYTYSIDDFLVDLFSYHESLRVWLRPPFKILAFLFTTLTTLSTILNLSVLCM